MNECSLTQKAISIIQSRGHLAQSKACNTILQTQYDQGTVCEALHYYAKDVLPRVLPIFPALISLSSRAFGATPKKTNPVAAAMLLVTASGDIHDDIVDNSTKKFAAQTIMGKYGRDTALLAGDVLLVQGIAALQNECCSLPSGTGQKISDLVCSAMFELAKAEAIETSLWQKRKVSPQEYFEVIRHKGAVAELHCRVGGLIGGAEKENLENLKSYGRTIGVLAVLKEEFVDLSNPMELRHRIKHELPPYPMLCALENDALREKFEVDKKGEFEDLPLVVEAVLGSLEVGKIQADFSEFGRKELACNPLFDGGGRAGEMRVLLEALTDELVLV
jgi:heptaprenyl diphosphate synthase